MRLVSLLVSFALLLLFLMTSVSANETIEMVNNESMHKFTNMTSADREQIKCIATGIYNEARHEPELGKIAVAKVILNRVDHGFAPTPCKVVYQSRVINVLDDDTGYEKKVKVCQFSWVCFVQKAINVLDPAYIIAERIAFEAFVGMHATVVPPNVLFFHSASINPNWRYKRYGKIGGNVFYAKK